MSLLLRTNSFQVQITPRRESIFTFFWNEGYFKSKSWLKVFFIIKVTVRFWFYIHFFPFRTFFLCWQNLFYSDHLRICTWYIPTTFQIVLNHDCIWKCNAYIVHQFVFWDLQTFKIYKVYMMKKTQLCWKNVERFSFKN